jgi:hypothetical protein
MDIKLTPICSVCVISTVRLHSLVVVTHSLDPAFDNAPVAAFSVVETNVALICACLPTLRPLLAQWFSGLSNSSAGTAGTPSGGGGYGSHGLSSHGHKRSSVLPALSSHGMALGTMRGRERLDGETAEDKIKVVTRVDISVSQKSGRSPGGNDSSVKDDRESSTESLFRDGKYSGHMV